MSTATGVDVAADDTEGDRETDGVRFSSSRRSKGEERRPCSRSWSEAFLFLVVSVFTGTGMFLQEVSNIQRPVWRRRLLLSHFEVILDML